MEAAVIREKLRTDDRWLYRGILAIYNRQTGQEQTNGCTIERNGVGFNGVDAPLLTDFAIQLERTCSLSPKQREIARRRMPKYARQLMEIANG